MPLTIPPYIKQEACFGLISPAGKIDPDVIPKTEKFLKQKGYRVKTARHASSEYFRFSANDKDRHDDLQTMLNDPVVDVIWCYRGGYGAIRIIENLDFSKVQQHPKWLIGFSDITILHAAFHNIPGLATIHGPMPSAMAKANDFSNWPHIEQLLKGEKLSLSIHSTDLFKPGKARGQIIGGNLSILNALSGTPYDFDPQGKILFIEEVGEYLYHTDRMMHNLKLSGKLNGLAGLIAGQFTEMKDNPSPFGQSAYEIIREVVKDYDYPVLYNFPAGHTSPNEPLMFGVEAELEVTENGGTIFYPTF